MNTSKIIVALDGFEFPAAVALARKLSGHVRGFKGHDLLDGSESPERVVKTLTEYGEFFADVKVHDIPQTAANRAKKYAQHGAAFFSAHASGGPEMMRAAVESFNEYKHATAHGVLAITVLTSINPKTCDEIYHGTPSATARRLAEIAADARVWGTVSSPNELIMLGGMDKMKGIRKVTPGVRSVGVASNDQSRIDTPENAVQNGADSIVMGREITTAADPLSVVLRVNAATRSQAAT